MPPIRSNLKDVSEKYTKLNAEYDRCVTKSNNIMEEMIKRRAGRDTFGPKPLLSLQKELDKLERKKALLEKELKGIKTADSPKNVALVAKTGRKYIQHRDMKAKLEAHEFIVKYYQQNQDGSVLSKWFSKPENKNLVL
ncbi:hypothetical protein TRVA0_001S10506 [Trichomonascus vanleenenianus]|uniref:uncharacterized protein n=1 Tax=Trichomonascus vanleenenianus TaxID=2268995 RepID=UPI003ECB0FBF